MIPGLVANRPSLPQPLAQLLREVQTLYSLPAVAMQVVKLTAEPKVDLRKLKECIEADPALTARILRTVNSSLFGLSRQVTDLNQSLALLGLRPLKMLVLGFSLPPAMTNNLHGDALRAYWRRTLMKAVGCRLLAQRVRQPEDEAFIAGLLQDVGALVLWQKRGEQYRLLRGDTFARDGDLLLAERDALGFDHLELSAGLLEQWRLPQRLALAVSGARSRAAILELPGEARPLAQALLTGGALADVIDRPSRERFDELLAYGRDYFHLNHDALQRLVQELYPQVRQFSEVLSVEVGELLDTTDVVLEAQAQLAEVCAESAGDLLVCGGEQDAFTQIRALQQELRRTLAEKPTSPPAAPRRDTTPLPTTPTERRATCSDQLEFDPGLRGRITAALTTSRQNRTPLSLAICEVDARHNLLLHYGPQRGLEQLARLFSDVEAWLGPEADCLVVGDARLAILLPDCSRNDALARIRELLGHVRSAFAAGASSFPHGVTLSAGVATLLLPPKNFPPAELVSAARRCLSSAQLSGGDSVKSIEL